MWNIVNNDTLNCIHYTVACVANDSALVVTKAGNYETSEIYVTRMADEDSNVTFEFSNKLGQVLLTRRVQYDGVAKELLDTYYLYDDLGNQVVVLPPEASDIFKNSTSSSWNS